MEFFETFCFIYTLFLNWKVFTKTPRLVKRGEKVGFLAIKVK